MPFLPMKYPEYRISMEAALPSSVHGWLRYELEQRGIDSIVYTRYIISLLLQDGEDFEGSDPDLESFPRSKRKGRKSERQEHLSVSEEERKKFAVVKCLSAISDEKSGIETLVEELCSRLKDSEVQASARSDVKTRSSSSDGSGDDNGINSSNKDKAQKYYAAFPALHGQSVSTNKSSSETVWKNNPFVKSLQTSEEESSSANEDAEIRKINIPSHVSVPKRKPRKNNSRTRKEYHDHNRKRDNKKNEKGRKYKKSNNSDLDIPSWPPGFAKLDPVFIQSLNIADEDFIPAQVESPKRRNNELCTKVESLLKGMLLPVPDKTYKELQDVDYMIPDIMRQKVNKKSDTDRVEGKPELELEGNVKSDGEISDEIEVAVFGEINGSVGSSRDESVSPEHQEQEIWYTQPIDVIFHSQEDDNVVDSNSKLRLYKRNSNPVFSPDPDSTSECAAEHRPSITSSPISFDRHRNQSFISDNDDDIWEGSVLIPAWLTEVISADENSDENQDDIDVTRPFKSSSPLPASDSGCIMSKLADLSMSDDGFSLALEDSWKPISFSSDASHDVNQVDENSTPTPDDVFKPYEDNSLLERPLSVSLVDLNYLSKFVDPDPGWQALGQDDFICCRRSSYPTLWQSQVLFDVSLNLPENLMEMDELNDYSGWHPLGTSSFSQLWDVNMHNRSRVSVWGGQICHADEHVWLAENNFVFMHDLPGLELDLNCLGQSSNTLIPRISIDIASDAGTSSSSFLEDQKNEENIVPYIDHCISSGEGTLLWNTDRKKEVDPKLSKSFELVPSEYSAFNDVPRKLVHTHSEPNLVQFRKEFGDGNCNAPSSPHEHLFFSPKTHFRPITPAYLPELFSAKAKQQVCHDLFGGLPSTKTPYQQYQVLDKDSDDESFIPSFKVKNYSKSIQTGESFDKVDNVEEVDSVGIDTPETLTISIIEDVMEEKIDTLMSLFEEQDTANTDSAYETDYGGNQGVECENDHKHGSCCYQQDHLLEESGLLSSVNIDKGFMGDLSAYKVESFEATFPHTNDWPDVCGAKAQSENCWKDNDPDISVNPWPSVECQALCFDEDYPENGHQSVGQNTWGEDLGLDHLYRESEMERYKNIWSSAGQEFFSVEVGIPGNQGSEEGYHGNLDDEQYDNVPSEEYYRKMLAESYSNIEDCFQYRPVVEPCEQKQDKNVTELEQDSEEIFPFFAGFPELDAADLHQNTGHDPETDSGDYLFVKLVYKDKMDENNAHQSYGTYDLMPMPDEAVTLTDLEKQWLDTNMWTRCKPSSAQRKPCSFYLEGNCRRSDCKFAHDISNITCRFWEEGGCFKGPLCPFLHGYPRVSSPAESNQSPEELDKEKFDLNNDEFPELSLSVKNGNAVSTNHKKNKVKSNVTGRKEKGRKGNGRRHSNKENRCEVKIVNKCSSSV